MGRAISEPLRDLRQRFSKKREIEGSEYAIGAAGRAARWHQQVNLITRNRWAMAARGGLALAVGTLVLIWPRPSVSTLASLFAVYAFMDGIFTIIASLRTAGRGEWWWGLLLEGVTGIATGLLASLWSWSNLSLLYGLIAFWSLVTGGFELAVSVRLRREMNGEVWLTLCGVCSLLFGILMLNLSSAGLRPLPWLLGSYTIGFGTLLLTLSAQLERLSRDHAEAQQPA